MAVCIKAGSNSSGGSSLLGSGVKTYELSVLGSRAISFEGSFRKVFDLHTQTFGE